MDLAFISQILAHLTLASNVAVILFLGYLVYCRVSKNKFSKSPVYEFITTNGLWLAFAVATTATLGSLYYSEIMQYEPCKLCWFQRIFMYPLSPILLIAAIRKDFGVFRYVTPLAIIGGIISIYHYIIQRSVWASTCGAESAVPCTVKYTFQYGYITIVTMAFSAFLLILLAMLIIKHKSKS